MIEINNQTKSRIDVKLVKNVVWQFLKYFKVKKKEVSIIFIEDDKMISLNNKYRGYNKPTDVLSFPDTDDDNYLGEVIVDYEQIKRQANNYSNNEKEELLYIVVHGLLHLLGYEDEEDDGKDEMYRLADKFLKTFN